MVNFNREKRSSKEIDRREARKLRLRLFRVHAESVQLPFILVWAKNKDDALDWDINENTEKGLNIGKEKDLLKYLTEQCEFYANQAKRSLDNIDDSESKQYLVNLTDLVIESAAKKSKK